MVKEGLSVKEKVLTVLTALVIFLPAAWSHAAELTLKDVRIQVYFSPDGGATDAIVREIAGARSEVLMQAYVIASQPIVTALLNAHKKGVAVKVIIDKTERGEGMTPEFILANAGAQIFLDNKHVLAHSNIIIIDQQTVITGSFNFTKAAEETNAEDMLVIKSPELAKVYRDAWERHRDHSERH